MAEYTRNDYLAGLQKANDAQDADAIKYFESKLRELDLFEGKQRAEEANDMGGVEYFNKKIEEETGFGDTGLGGDALIFNKLHLNKDYTNSLISYYSEEGNRPKRSKSNMRVDKMYNKNGKFIGNQKDIDFLKEKNFEYWNATMLNILQMGNTALEIMNSDDAEKDTIKNLFEVYERTKITGKGSRSGFEQAKDAWHILYDPTTWLGGSFLMKPAQKAASRKAIMLALTKGGEKAKVKGFQNTLELARKIKNKEASLETKKLLSTLGIIEGQREIGKRAKLTLHKKLMQKGLSREEANFIVKKTARKTARRSAVIGSAYTGGWDAAIQTGLQNQLDPEREYSATQTAVATGLGAGLGYAIPGAARFAGKVLKAPGAIVTKGLPKTVARIRDPAGIIRDPIARALGGKKAARSGVAEQAEKSFGSKTGQGPDVTADDMVLNLNEAKEQGFNKLKNEYTELGLLEEPGQTFLTSQLKAIERNINGKGSELGVQEPIGDLSYVIQKLNANEIDASKALRDFRRIIGEQYGKAISKKTADKDILKGYNTKIRNLFTKQAEKVGKGKEAKRVDQRFGEWIEAVNDKKMLNILDKSSTARAEVARAINSRNSSLINEHITNINKIAKFSNSPSETKRIHMDALRELTSENLFAGQNATTFKRYLSNRDGIHVLKQIYPRNSNEIDHLAKIMKNSERGGTVGMFAMRLMTAAVAGTYGFGVGGPVGSALIGGSGYIIVEKLLNSRAFQNMAMKTFSKDPVKNLTQAAATFKLVRKMFPKLNPDTTNEVMNIILGGSMWGALLANDENLRSKMRGGIKFAGDTGGDVMKFLMGTSWGQKAKQTGESLDSLSRKLGVENLPGYEQDSFSKFVDEPSFFNQ